MFAFIARLFGKTELTFDQGDLHRFKQLRERNTCEEPASGKKDLLIRMRRMELQTASIIRLQHGNGVDDIVPDAIDSHESSGRDLTGRKGF